jgi:hypothetical protein
MLVTKSTPHAAYAVNSSATYFHSNDHRTLAESIPFTIKCLDTKSYLSAILTYVKWLSIVLCGENYIIWVSMMKVHTCATALSQKQKMTSEHNVRNMKDP